MDIELMRFKLSIKNKMRSAWHTLTKPLARVFTKISDRSYIKLRNECMNLSDEKLMRKYARYIVKSLLREQDRNPDSNPQREYIVFNKGAYDYVVGEFTGDFKQRILYDLQMILADSKCRDNALKHWYSFKQCEILYTNIKTYQENLIYYEKELNELLKKELDKLGVYAEYEYERNKKHMKNVEKEHHDKWLDKIGYEKSLIVRLS